MEDHRRPPHYYGLPSQAPRKRAEPVPETLAGAPAEPRRAAPPSAHAATPPPRRLKRPHERYGGEADLPISVERYTGSKPNATEPPDGERPTHRARPHTPTHTHVRVPPGAALRANVPNYVNRLPAIDASDDSARDSAPPPLVRRPRKRALRREPFKKRAWRAARYLLAIGALALTFTILTSPKFAVKKVDVPRDLTVTPPAVVAKVASGLIGQNWLRARTRLATRQLEALPMVRGASIVRELRWPPRMELQIDERKAYARVGAGDQWWVVDENGIPFRPAVADDGKLNAITGRALSPKLGAALPHDAWEPVLQFTGALNQDNRRGQAWEVQRIYFDDFGNASLRLADKSHNKMLIRLGSDRWNDKLTRARAALAYFAETGRDAEVLDLRLYSRPLWKPRTTDAAADARGEQADANSTGVEAGSNPADDGAPTDNGNRVPQPVTPDVAVPGDSAGVLGRRT